MSILDLLNDIGMFINSSGCYCYKLNEELCSNCADRNDIAKRVEAGLKDIIKETLRSIE